MSDVNVSVFDLRTSQQVLDTFPLNKDECVEVEIFADSSGKGSAKWVFRSSDGSVNSEKQNPDIADGARDTLG
jgi:hypothetical protein